MNASQNILRAGARRFIQTSARNQSSAAAEVPSSKFASLKETQKLYAAEDGVPVYIKRGATDKILLGITTVLTSVGLAMSAEVLYSQSFPPAQDE